jgi:hypothetical protein
VRLSGLGVAVLLVVAVGVTAPAEGKRATQCQRLHGKDIAPAPKVKLVRRRNDDGGTDLRGCVLPRGPVRLVASSVDLETTVEGYRVLQVAGAVVLLATSHDSQYASARSTSVFDLRDGRDYTIATDCSRLDTGSCEDPRATAAAAFVNRRGQAAAAIVPFSGDTTTIVGFDSRGRRRDLDAGPSMDIPASSLQLRGRTVTWTHAGETRTATLIRE